MSDIATENLIAALDDKIKQQRAEIERLKVGLREIWSVAPNIAIAQEIARVTLEEK